MRVTSAMRTSITAAEMSSQHQHACSRSHQTSEVLRALNSYDSATRYEWENGCLHFRRRWFDPQLHERRRRHRLKPRLVQAQLDERLNARRRQSCRHIVAKLLDEQWKRS